MTLRCRFASRARQVTPSWCADQRPRNEVRHVSERCQDGILACSWGSRHGSSVA